MSVREIADGFRSANLPNVDVVPRGSRGAHFGMATILTELMWEQAARWANQNFRHLPTSDKESPSTGDLKPFDVAAKVASLGVEPNPSKLFLLLKNGTGLVLSSAFNEVLEIPDTPWTLDRTKERSLRFCSLDNAQMRLLLHRGTVTGQDQYWDVAPALPDTFLRCMGRRPYVSEFPQVLRGLKVNNESLGLLHSEIFGALLRASVTLYKYSADSSGITVDRSAAYHVRTAQRPGAFVVDFVPEVYAHSLVAEAREKVRGNKANPTLGCAAAWAYTFANIMRDDGSIRKGKATVINAQSNWYIDLTVTHCTKAMISWQLLLPDLTHKLGQFTGTYRV